MNKHTCGITISSASSIARKSGFKNEDDLRSKHSSYHPRTLHTSHMLGSASAGSYIWPVDRELTCRCKVGINSIHWRISAIGTVHQPLHDRVDLIYPNVEELMSGSILRAHSLPRIIQPWYLSCRLLFRARGIYSPDPLQSSNAYRHHISTF